MRLVPQLDTWPRLIASGQSAAGRGALLAAFAALMALHQMGQWPAIITALALTTWLPTHRRAVLSLAALGWLLLYSGPLPMAFLVRVASSEGVSTGAGLTLLIYGCLALALGAVAAFFHYLTTPRASFAARRPVLCVLGLFGMLLLAADLLPLSGMARVVAWTLVGVTAPYLWYFAYALKDAPSRAHDGFLLQIGVLQPFWGGTNVPYPKGAANLRRIEASTAEELCLVQLKAIKLLLWALWLKLALVAVELVAYGGTRDELTLLGLEHVALPSLTLPVLGAALTQPVSVPVAWGSVLAHFVQTLLSMALTGHIIIACCRMAGFRALRNTYRPLEARTIADFWNRYYYYFKELLVEFFFFPTFTRYFKKNRALRGFAATLAAATFGNCLYHFMRDYHYIAERGLWQAVVGFQVYIFYATVLGTGIGISQLRSQRRGALSVDAPWWLRLGSTAGVLAFFCLLEIFDQEERTYSLLTCLRFLLHLFSIHI